jgi:hypothetical protein
VVLEGDLALFAEHHFRFNALFFGQDLKLPAHCQHFVHVPTVRRNVVPRVCLPDLKLVLQLLSRGEVIRVGHVCLGTHDDEYVAGPGVLLRQQVLTGRGEGEGVVMLLGNDPGRLVATAGFRHHEGCWLGQVDQRRRVQGIEIGPHHGAIIRRHGVSHVHEYAHAVGAGGIGDSLLVIGEDDLGFGQGIVLLADRGRIRAAHRFGDSVGRILRYGRGTRRRLVATLAACEGESARKEQAHADRGSHRNWLLGRCSCQNGGSATPQTQEISAVCGIRVKCRVKALDQ